MRKIEQGKYELFTTKKDAIDKFMQMQGVCIEEISGEKPILFYCTKKGKIAINSPPGTQFERTISTNLFAQIIEHDGKTYITYYTAYSKFHSIFKVVTFVYLIVMAIVAIILTVVNASMNEILLIFLVLSLLFFIFQLYNSAKEQKNSPKDSKILIKELEKRVEAVNLWDKN